MEIFLLLLSIIVCVLGIILSALPGMPGPGISFLALVILYFAPTYADIATNTLIAFGIGALAISFINNFIPLAVAKSAGASKYALSGGLIGLCLGMLIFPPLGSFIGIFIGAVIGELFIATDISRAINAGIGTLVGIILAQLLTIAYSLVIFVYGTYILLSTFFTF